MRYPPSFYATLPRLVIAAWKPGRDGLYPVFVWSNRTCSRIEGMAGGSPVVVRQ